MSFLFLPLRLVLALAALLLLPAFSLLFAQDVRVETQQQARVRAESTQEEETTEKVADSELGDINLVSRAPRPKMFTFFTSQSLNYTSNAFLVRDGEQSDLFWQGGVGAWFIPYATRNFTPKLRFDQNWFRYHDFGVLDFDMQSLQLDLKYDLNRDDTWFVDGFYAVSRLSAPRGSTGEFYRDGFLNLSITHRIQLQKPPIFLEVSGGAYSRHGDPSSSDRVAGYVVASAIYNIRDDLQLSGFIRPEGQHYTHDPSGSREDFNLTVGAGLTWSPKEYLAVSAAASYVGNFSNVSQRRYDVVTPTLFVGAQIAF
ncbi:MAG: hypothetical protein WAO00_01450 [Chthoniobacterales bacterium]